MTSHSGHKVHIIAFCFRRSPLFICRLAEIKEFVRFRRGKGDVCVCACVCGCEGRAERGREEGRERRRRRKREREKLPQTEIQKGNDGERLVTHTEPKTKGRCESVFFSIHPCL